MEPLVVEFEVDARIEHAFDMWTRRTALWWPRTHAMSGHAISAVTFEPRTGGRIFEESANGDEHDWGEIVAWDPPHRLAYIWHLFFDRSEATDVVVTFTATSEGTVIRIEQSGFERLGAAGAPRREKTYSSWGVVVEALRTALAER